MELEALFTSLGYKSQLICVCFGRIHNQAKKKHKRTMHVSNDTVHFRSILNKNNYQSYRIETSTGNNLIFLNSYCPFSRRSKLPDPIPREIEGKPFSNPPTDPLHPHIVQPRTKIGGHDAMSMHPQARSQSERPDPSGASRTGGAPLRKFTGTSLPNSKVSDSSQCCKKGLY